MRGDESVILLFVPNFVTLTVVSVEYQKETFAPLHKLSINCHRFWAPTMLIQLIIANIPLKIIYCFFMLGV
jgi:hypothetical protein